MSRIESGERSQVLALLAVVTVGGGYLRLEDVQAGKHLWNDSVVSLVVVDRLGPLEILTVLPQYDPHPPLYYLFLDAWTAVFGSSVLAGRSMSVVLGVASIPLLYLVAAEVSDSSVGLVSAALLAVSPYHVRISQTVRMYALLLTASLISYLLFLRLIDRWERDRGFLYAAATFVAGAVHAFGALVLMAQSLTVMWLYRRDGLTAARKHVLGLQSIVGLLLAPWYITLLENSMTGGTYPIDWLTEPDHVDFLESFMIYLKPELAEIGVLWTAALLPASMLLLIGILGKDVVSSEPETEDAGVLLGLWLVAPVVVAFLASYVVRPVLHPRYFAGTSVAAVVAVSRGVYSIETRDLRILLLVTVLAVSGLGLSTYYEETAAVREEFPWESSASYIDGNAASGDVVIVDHGDAARELTEIQIAPNESIESSDFFDVHLRREDIEVVGLEDVGRDDLRHAVGCHRGAWVVFHGTTSSRDRIEHVMDEMYEMYEVVERRMFDRQILVARYRQNPDERPECR